eukprot:TRINITY_DN3024_c0_g1_i1.p2 TRINITY_DN3024_c0_g1~~TRINITY_DN3024_c0_g1_i1.p2  ORF type:complete len:124 (-),score=22.39 TRINITY_DN3024_c0_g1_i1:1380-1751(-)
MGIEEARTNSIMESLQQFHYLTNISDFQQTPFIVFLNKVDLLKKKLDNVAFNLAFPSYTSDSSRNEVVNVTMFLRSLFLEKSCGRRCFFHNTCAMDSESCKKVWQSVVTDALTTGLVTGGMMM